MARCEGAAIASSLREFVSWTTDFAQHNPARGAANADIGASEGMVVIKQRHKFGIA
jgi:hypothetical protein